MRPQSIAGATLCALAALLVACSSTPLGTAQGEASANTPVTLLPGVPLPAGSRLKAEQSLLIGSGDQWVGRAVIDAGRDTDAVFQFFSDSLQGQGWTLLTSVRGKTSLLVFSRQERTLTVELQDAMLSAPQVILTMAPRNATVLPARRP